jgi:hypothetical protein
MHISEGTLLKQVIQGTRHVLEGNPQRGIRGVLEPFQKHPNNLTQALQQALGILEQNQRYYQDSLNLSLKPPKVTVHSSPNSFVEAITEDLRQHGSPEQVKEVEQTARKLLEMPVGGAWSSTNPTSPSVEGHMLIIDGEPKLLEDVDSQPFEMLEAGLNSTGNIVAHEFTHIIQSIISKALASIPTESEIKQAFDVGNRVSEIRQSLFDLIQTKAAPHKVVLAESEGSLSAIKKISSLFRYLEEKGLLQEGQQILNSASQEELEGLKHMFTLETQAHSNGLRNQQFHLPLIDNQMLPLYALLKSMVNKAGGSDVTIRTNLNPSSFKPKKIRRVSCSVSDNDIPPEILKQLVEATAKKKI